MSIDALAQSELRQLFALIGRNIGGDPLPPERPEYGDTPPSPRPVSEPASGPVQVSNAMKAPLPVPSPVPVAISTVSPPTGKATPEALDMAEHGSADVPDLPSATWTLAGLRLPAAARPGTAPGLPLPRETPALPTRTASAPAQALTGERFLGTARETSLPWTGATSLSENAPTHRPGVDAAPSRAFRAPVPSFALPVRTAQTPSGALPSGEPRSATTIAATSTTSTSLSAVGTTAAAARPETRDAPVPALATSVVEPRSEPSAPAIPTPAPVPSAGAPAGGAVLVSFLEASGLLIPPAAEGEDSSLQTERAGVIASFILNAAMIPGWPPPRPIEAAGFARALALPAPMRGLDDAEREAGLLLLHAIRDSGLAGRLFVALAAERRRRRLLAVLAMLATEGRALLDLVAAGMAEALPASDLAETGGRRRLVLR